MLDHFQVFPGAHMIAALIPLIHALGLFAGILAALKTEGSLLPFCAVIDPGALCKHVGAGLISRPAANTLAALEAVFVGQIVGADRAVHPAGGDQLF